MDKFRRAYDVEIAGSAEPRRIWAEVLKDGSLVTQTAKITLGAGERRTAQITLDAEPGRYQVRQVTNTGSNIHEDLVMIDLGEIDHEIEDVAESDSG